MPPRRAASAPLRALAAALAAALVAAGCFESCALNGYNRTDGSLAYSVDLRGLCNNGSGYTFINGSTTYKFEICGTIDPVFPPLPAFVGDGNVPGQVVGSAQTNTYCNPEYNAYPNAGSFLIFFDPNPATTCYYGPTSGTPAPATPGGTPYGGCPFTGSVGAKNLPYYCCTGQCEVLAAGSQVFLDWLSDDFATGGVHWTTAGVPATTSNEFQCPIDPNTGYPRSQAVSIAMDCNAAGKMSDPLIVSSVYDVQDCQYRARLSHKAACGVPAPSSGGGGGSNSSGGNSQADSTALLPNLSAGAGASLLVLAGAAAGVAALCFALQARKRCGECRLPRVTISVKYDDEGEREQPALLGTAYGAAADTRPLRSLGR